MRLCIIQILYFRYFLIQLYKDHQHLFQISLLDYKKGSRNFFLATFTKILDKSKSMLHIDTPTRVVRVFHDLSMYSQKIEGPITEAPTYWSCIRLE